MRSATVYKKQRPTIRRAATKEIIDADFHPQQDAQDTTGSSIGTIQIDLTPKQMMQKRKEEEVLKREEELKQAAGDAKSNYN